jgi:hypothetical protein
MSRKAKLTLGILATAVFALGTALAGATITQKGTLRVAVNSNLSPSKLPRQSKAPIAVSVGWKISTADGTEPPKLKTLEIEINRNGVLDPTGIPTCPYNKIQPASTSRALSNCRSALVGTGDFSAIVGLEGQESYVAKGRMVVFNSRKGGKPVLYGQIYSGYPFSSSFVITFKVNKVRKGTFGTALTAVLPASLREWGNLTEINMKLSRKFVYKGVHRSFLSAGCPTPDGLTSATFKLARTSFSFDGGQRVATTLTDICKVRN